MAYPKLFDSARLGAIYLGPPPTKVRPAASLIKAGGGDGAGGGGGHGSSGGGDDYQLHFTMQRQMQDQWCWAAVSVSVAIFYLPASLWTQCRLVSDEVGDPTCCVDGSTNACDVPWWLDKALARTNNLQRWQDGPLTGAAIKAELAANLALACRIGWSDGVSGHFVALTGYQNDGGSETVVVDDPLYGQSQISLAEFTRRYRNDGVWTHSYYTRS